MVATYFLAAGALAAFAQAAPGLPSRTSYTANFSRSANASEGDTGFGLPVTLPGVYDGLYYSVFQPYFGPYHIGPDSGIDPSSPYFGAAFGDDPQSFTSTLQSNPGPASVSVNYKQSKAVAFDVSSFFFGCTQGVTTYYPESGNSLTLYNPSNCTLTVKGYRLTRNTLPSATEKPDVTATFDFVPQSTPNSFLNFLFIAPMQEAKLPRSFIGLKTVTFSVSNRTVHPDPKSNSTYGAPAAYLDDLKYTVLSL